MWAVPSSQVGPEMCIEFQYGDMLKSGHLEDLENGILILKWITSKFGVDWYFMFCFWSNIDFSVWYDLPCLLRMTEQTKFEFHYLLN
jgi:hypothetical protein